MLSSLVLRGVKVMGVSGRMQWLCRAAVAALALGSLPLAMHHMSHSVWHDESQTRLIARQPTLGEVTALAMKERPYPPLFFFAVHYSLHLRDDETGLRLPAALFGALSVVAVFLVGSALVDVLTGTIAAFLFVLTPGAFRYFVDGNAYTLLMLASALSTLYLWKAAHSDATRDWAAYAACALLGLGTHSLFIVHVGAQLLAGVFLTAHARPVALRSFKRMALVAGLLVGAALLWTLYYAHAGGQTRPFNLSRLPELSTLVSMVGMLAGPQSFGDLAQLVLWGPLLALGGAALYRTSRSGFWSAGIMISVPLVAVPLFAKLTLPYVAYRYGLGIFPLACVVAACSWKLRPQRLLPRAGASALILAYCAVGAVFMASAGVNTFGYQDWRSASGYLADRFSVGDVVLVPGDHSPLPFSYYWTGPEPLRSRESPQAISASLAQVLVTRDAASSRGWVVLSSFARENPLVGRYTEWRRRDDTPQVGELAQALEGRGLRLCRTVSFQRVTVLEVRRSSCQQGP
jgi:4-amino-4-deoxy-L-arabinose transferase-like glycosyltransferase